MKFVTLHEPIRTSQAIAPPTENELNIFRALHARAAEAHRCPVELPTEISP